MNLLWWLEIPYLKDQLVLCGFVGNGRAVNMNWKYAKMMKQSLNISEKKSIRRKKDGKKDD